MAPCCPPVSASRPRRTSSPPRRALRWLRPAEARALNAVDLIDAAVRHDKHRRQSPPSVRSPRSVRILLSHRANGRQLQGSRKRRRTVRDILEAAGCYGGQLLPRSTRRCPSGAAPRTKCSSSHCPSRPAGQHRQRTTTTADLSAPVVAASSSTGRKPVRSGRGRQQSQPAADLSVAVVAPSSLNQPQTCP